MKKLSLYLSLIISALILVACSDTPPPPAKATVNLAEAKQYQALPDDQLGVNENAKGLAPGTKLGSIELSTMAGKPYDLSAAWQQKPALIIFYRGGWCPFCNAQVRELSQNYEKLAAAGVQPILISVDAPDKAALIDSVYDIPFPVLSDTELLAHFAFNVALELEFNDLIKYKSYGVTPSDWSNAKHNTIGIASAFIVDQQGLVRFSHAPANFSSRPSVPQLLTIIDLLNF